ncbi:MAG TPA: hypothetical protein VK363_19250 [Pyrinomonadaceae bacterium]|nr:hypothetical protein [Pyrinomonadaceae bacterium]
MNKPQINIAAQRAAFHPLPLSHPPPGQSEALARQARAAEEAQLTKLRDKYAGLKNEEAELERAVSCVTIDTDYKTRARQLAELAALREVLEAFPLDVCESYSRMTGGRVAPEQSQEERLCRDSIRRLQREINDFGKEIAAFDYRLGKPATLPELRPFAYADSAETAYKNSLRARRASALAEVQRRQQEIAELEQQIEKLQTGS